MAEDDIVKEAKEAFQYAQDCEQDNRTDALDDLKFSRLGEQWPENIVSQRKREGRPCLTINKMQSFIRQVVNDARQNKPSIHVHPVDSGADKETADILNGLIRNIEYTSSADVAYDTATEYAVSMGFGYFRIGLDYAHEDTFDLDISIDRVSNPFSIYRDPMSQTADSSDWNTAFEMEIISKEDFEKQYKDAAKVDWQGEGYNQLADPWHTEESVMIARWWKREEYEKKIYLLSDGTLQSEKQMEILKDLLVLEGKTVVKERMAKCYRVKRYKMTGLELLEDPYDWPGQYIPIVPVYGDEVDVEGKRFFRSLIRDAKGAQQMFNVWRSYAMESVALAPKTPFIGEEGAFDSDPEKWATANTNSWSYISFKRGHQPPQRQPFVGVPAGALQEALNASDDMKAIMGLYDASLGARSNETSGVAIRARDRQGDVSTFHFQDNMARAIRHAGRIILGLIPHVYDERRIIRTIGEDQTQEQVQLKQPVPVTDENGQQKMEPAKGPNGEPIMEPGPNGPVQKMTPMTRIFDLTAGKYDLTVKTGPSFTTRREEASVQMTEMMRGFPASAPIIGPHLAENLDWPGADKIAEDLKKLSPANQQPAGIPPELQKQIEEGMAKLQQLEQENAALKADQGVKMMELQIKQQEAGTKQFEAETDRARLQHEMTQPTPMPQQPGLQ